MLFVMQASVVSLDLWLIPGVRDVELLFLRKLQKPLHGYGGRLRFSSLLPRIGSRTTYGMPFAATFFYLDTLTLS
jgi:hypothetical protein